MRREGPTVQAAKRPARSAAPCRTLLRLDNIRIWQNGKPEEDGFDLTGGADDRIFRLDRAPLDDRSALITDRKELAAVRHK